MRANGGKQLASRVLDGIKTKKIETSRAQFAAYQITARLYKLIET
jgi:hypothetical protein